MVGEVWGGGGPGAVDLGVGFLSWGLLTLHAALLCAGREDDAFELWGGVGDFEGVEGCGTWRLGSVRRGAPRTDDGGVWGWSYR